MHVGTQYRNNKKGDDIVACKWRVSAFVGYSQKFT